MALLAFCRHGDQRILNSVAVNGFLLLLTLSLPLKGGLGKTGSLKVGQ